jgi:hypothetical protein
MMGIEYCIKNYQKAVLYYPLLSLKFLSGAATDYSHVRNERNIVYRL